MRDDVALVHECANNIGAAEVHAQFRARRRRVSVSVGNIDRVSAHRVFYRVAIDLEHPEVNLMYMENVIFEGCVADDPILHGSLMDNQGWGRIQVE